METPHTAAGAIVREWFVRAEDVLLAIWVAVVVPGLYRLQGSAAGPFDPGRPIDGLIGLAGIAGAVACLAARPAPVESPGLSRAGLGGSAAVGPFAGGLLAVGASAASGLGLATPIVEAYVVGLVVLAIVVRVRMPAPSVRARRALTTPYLVAAGGLFASFIDAVTAGDVPGRLRAAAPVDLAGVAPVIGFLLAFSAVFYAMLIYAPRQVAEREGGALAWLVRYGCFALSVALGAGWITFLAG